VDSRDVDAIEDTNIALQRENAELRAELGRMAVLVDLSADKSIDEDFGNEDLWSLVHKWLPKQEAQP
jgi:hypothetical protein